MRDCVLYSMLTNSQLCSRFLAQLAELCSVDVVGFKDADELLQSFLTQPTLHILLRPIGKQQPGVTRQLPSCKTHNRKGASALLLYRCLLQQNLSDANKQFPLTLHRKGHTPFCADRGLTITCLHTYKKINLRVVLYQTVPACSSSTLT